MTSARWRPHGLPRFRRSPGQRRSVALLESIQTGIEDILYRQGVEPFSSRTDRVRSATAARGFHAATTEDPALNKTVAARLRKGFARVRSSSVPNSSASSSAGRQRRLNRGRLMRSGCGRGPSRPLVILMPTVTAREILAVETRCRATTELSSIRVKYLAEAGNQVGWHAPAARSALARTP